MRISKSHVEAKVSIINGMLGFDNPQWGTVGSIQLYGDLTGYSVHRVVNESHGVSDLSGIGTLREAAQFLSGMIAALRIASEVDSNA